MTREQKIAKAKRLREGGLTYKEIAEQCGVSHHTAYRWLNPDYAERSREDSRAWKRRNKAHLRLYDKRYHEEHRGECSDCGGPTAHNNKTGVCLSCLEDRVDLRAGWIEQWWAEGRSLNEIADELGWTRNHVVVEMDRLRSRGYDLPYRYRGERNGTKFPKLQRAAA